MADKCTSCKTVLLHFCSIGCIVVSKYNCRLSRFGPKLLISSQKHISELGILHCVCISYTNISQILRPFFHMLLISLAIRKPLAASFILWFHCIHLITFKIVGYKNSLAWKAEYWWWFYTGALILPFSKLFNCKTNCYLKE